jgi:hypothetical protein
MCMRAMQIVALHMRWLIADRAGHALARDCDLATALCTFFSCDLRSLHGAASIFEPPRIIRIGRMRTHAA